MGRKIIAMSLVVLILSSLAFYPAKATNSGITYSMKDGIYYTHISPNALNEIREAQRVSRQGTNQKEMILKELGFKDSDISLMGEVEVNYIAEVAESITIADAYYKVDEEGKLKLITKEECEEKSQRNVSARNNSGNNQDLQSDGCFHITTMASYINPDEEGEIGWYIFSGLFRFIGVPTYRMIDAASLYASDVMWSQNDEDVWSQMMYSYSNYVTGTTGSDTETKGGNEAQVYETGLYFTWDLPDDDRPNTMPVKVVTDISIYVRGKARVSDYTDNYAFNLFTRYEHTFSALNIQPSFEWTYRENPGVSVSVQFEDDSNTYYSRCEVDYNPNGS